MNSSRRFYHAFRSFSWILTLLFYGLAFISMRFIISNEGFERWKIVQIGFTLGGMAALASLYHWSENLLLRSVALLFQFLGGLFLNLLTGSHVWLILLWALPLLVQFGLVMDLIALIPFSIIVIFGHFNDAEAVIAWGVVLPDARTRDRIIGAAISAGVALIVAGIRYLLDRLVDQEILVNNLKTNILKLTRANYDLQRYAADTEELTLEKERFRISREIHDTVGYTMTTLGMMLEASTDLVNDSPLMLEVQLRKALDIVNQGHHDIRLSLRELRERESERPRGLKGLKKLIDLFSETTGVAVKTEWGTLPWRFPDKIEAVLYRFVQEGMSNALSHGNATEISIHFRTEENNIVVVLSDDGVGADVLIEGLGLHGMRERIKESGGYFEARNTREGFFLHARLPLNEEDLIDDRIAHR